jgi:hypothetical protein
VLVKDDIAANDDDHALKENLFDANEEVVVLVQHCS